MKNKLKKSQNNITNTEDGQRRSNMQIRAPESEIQSSGTEQTLRTIFMKTSLEQKRRPRTVKDRTAYLRASVPTD